MADTDPIQIKTGMEVGYIAGSTREDVIDGPSRAEWAAMTEEEREEYLREVAQETLENSATSWAYVAEDED